MYWDALDDQGTLGVHNPGVTDLLQLCSGLPQRTIAAADVLIAEGAPPTGLYVLIDGSVTIERDAVPFARIDSPGSVFGEMSWILDKPATATVRAATPTTVFVMDDPGSFLAEHPDVALQILRLTAGRLDGLTRYLVDVKQQFADAEGHLGMVDQILDTLVHHQAPKPRTGSARDPQG